MMLARYAVIGNPIEHSKSPLIHTAFARQTGEQLSYTRILGDPLRFEQQVSSFFQQDGQGLNVTVPFKERAWRIADSLGEAARSAQAVNTLLTMPDGSLHGENTDGVGLVRDLTINHNRRLSGSRILLLGAGGAAKGVAGPLLAQAPELLLLANRTASKAQQLAQRLDHPGRVEWCGLEDLEGRTFDLIINATAAGLDAAVPALPEGLLEPGGWVYDLMYASQPTAFVRWGEKQQAGQCLDGLGMLVEQAAESFFLWRGVRPDTAPVIAMLSGG